MAKKINNKQMLLKDKVYLTLKERVLSGFYKSGSQLNPTLLSNELVTSITPIREALGLLQKDGLVDAIPRYGYYVSQLSVKDLQDIFEMRMILESYAIEKVAKTITHEQCNFLEEITLNVNPSNFESYEDYLKGNREFHRHIAQITENNWLTNNITNLLDRIQRVIYLCLDASDTAATAAEEHGELLMALRAKDSQAASMMMKKHITNTYEALLNGLIRTESLTKQLMI